MTPSSSRLRQLAPLRSSLIELLPDSVLTEVFPLLVGLDRLLPTGRPALDDDGEPDGFDGVDGRGPLDRVLISQMMLAAAEPDEFIRRFAWNELSFLKQARIHPRQRTISTVYFDAGPRQLGAPRLAQLAALLILAGRAEQANSEFRWRTLQSPEWHQATTEADVRAFLEARSQGDVVPGETADLYGDSPMETLLVTSPEVDGVRHGSEADWTLPPCSRLTLWDGSEPETVAAQFSSPAGTTSPVIQLALPSTKAAIGIFRNPFVAPTEEAPNDYGEIQAGPIFDQTGNKLFVVREHNWLEAHPVPSQPGDRAGPVIRHKIQSDGRIIAVNRDRKTIMAMVLNKAMDLITMHSMRGDHKSAQPFPVSPAAMEQVDLTELGGHYQAVTLGGSILFFGEEYFSLSADGIRDLGPLRDPTELSFDGDTVMIRTDDAPVRTVRMGGNVRRVVVGPGERAVGAVLEDGTIEAILVHSNEVLYSSNRTGHGA